MQEDDFPLLAAHGLRDKQGLSGLSLSVRPGQLVCLLGASGAGKSRALHIIAGRETPSHGDVFFNNRKITNDWLSRRQLCYVSQRPGLWLKQRGDAALLQAIGLDSIPLDEHFIRSALRMARALKLRPSMLVLDATAEGLPPQAQEKLALALRAAADEGMGILYAAHSMSPLTQAADCLLIMDQGCIVQEGEPQAVYESPCSETAARLTGDALFIRGRAVALKGDKLLLEAQGLNIPCQSDLWISPGERLTLFLRPEWLHWNKQGDAGFSPPLRAKLLQADPIKGGHRLLFELPNGQKLDLERAAVPGPLRKIKEDYLLSWDRGKALLLSPQMIETEDSP